MGEWERARRALNVLGLGGKMVNQFTAVFEQQGKWWIGYVEELPGANTQGKTLDETRVNLKEAAQLILQANRELAGEVTK